MELQLTRQQRRALERERKKQPTYNMTPTQVEEKMRQALEKHYEKVQERVQKDVTTVIIAAMLVNLNDIHGLGNKRLNELLKGFANTIDSLDRGYVAIDDLLEICKKQLKIDVERLEF